MADLIGKTIDHYRIVRRLGQGGMGTVYVARDLSLERDVAIKIISPDLSWQEDFQKQFLRRIREAAVLNHPNILTILDYDYKDGQLYMVMEFIAGGCLAAYLRTLRDQNTPVRLSDAVELATQVAYGLYYAQQLGMIHRNIKPDNLLLKTYPMGRDETSLQAVISDFGLAQLATSLEETLAGLGRGALVYMSPEVVLGKNIDGRADIYSLGVILYEMIVGKPPYEPESLTDLAQFFQQSGIPAPSQSRGDVPPELDRVVLKCLAKDPADRYQTADQLSRDLRQLKVSQTRREVMELEALPSLVEDADNQSTPVEPTMPITAPHKPAQTQPVESEDTVERTPRQPPLPPASVTQRTPPEPEPEAFDKLIITEENRPPRTVILSKDSFIIGRDDDNDIVLDHHRISRQHARLDRTEDGKYTITDLGTTNGTWLDNERLTPQMAAEWRPGSIVRIGDLWLTLQLSRASDLEATSPLFRPQRAPKPAAGGESYNTAVMEEVEDRVDALLIPAAIAVDPGGRGNLMLEIINLGTQADQFLVSVANIPATWITAPTYSIHLEAGDSATVPILLHPPRVSTSIAGPHPFSLQVRSLNQPNKSTAVQGQMQINGFYEFSAALQPERIRSGRVALVTINNQGNLPATYRIAPNEFQTGVNFQIPPNAIAVAPGQSAPIQIRVWSRSRPLLGGSRVVKYELGVSAEEFAGWQQLYGSLVVPPSISGLAIGLFFLLLLFACGTIAFLAYTQIDAANRANATATAVEAANRVNATATAVEDADRANATATAAVVAANATATQAAVPTATPTLDLSKPDQFVRFYYTEVNNRHYDTTYPLLTDHFRYATGTYTRDLYNAWWDRVKSVVIGDVHTQSQSSTLASVYAALTYHMQDGTDLVDPEVNILLVRDAKNTTWLIEAKTGLYIDP